MKNKFYKITLGLFAFLLITGNSKAQLSGNYSVPATFTSVAAAINSLNIAGVSGPVTIAISAGYTETVTVGGLSLTATGTNTAPITFIKSGAGANPVLYAYAGGTAVPNSAMQDGILSLIGSDFITIDGIDFTDPNIANPATMEFGIGFFKANAGDGCQNNLIQNCVITLNRVNNAAGALPTFEGSKGIQLLNSSRGTETTVITVTASAGSNSSNQFFSNTIQNCNYAIILSGFVDVSPFSFADSGNDIGGAAPATGNTLVNFGGGAGATNQAAAVRTNAQYNLNVSFNTVNNNNGSGVNHPTTMRGFLIGAAISANCSINSNTMSIKGGGTTSQISVIENASGASAANNTITINNNLITNCTNATNTSGIFYGIWNTASCAHLSISNNTFSGNTANSTSGTTYLVYNSGAVAVSNAMNSNNLGGITFSSPVYSGTMYNLYNSSSTFSTALSISSNTFNNITFVNTGSGTLYYLYNLGSSNSFNASNNSWSGLTLNHSGTEYFFYNSSSTQSVLTIANNTLTNITRNSTMGTTYMMYLGGSSLGASIHTFTGNLISNITATLSGSGTFYGMYNFDGASPYPQKTVFSNTVTNINISTTGTAYGLYASGLGDGGLTSGSLVYNNLIDNFSSGGTIYGLYNGSAASPNYTASIYSNTVSNISSNGNSSSIFAAYVFGGGVGTNFFKNRIYNIVSTGTTATVYGLYASSSPSTNIYNNLIGAISTPSSGGVNRLNGVYIGGGTNINLFYNTVHLNGTSTGADFSSNAIYASTTPSVNLRNNIFINLATPTGTGVSVAYRRSSATLTTYSGTSNNNIFYAGVPSASNLIYADGTSTAQTFPAYQGIVTPRDPNSGTENTSFLSIVGTNTAFLHVNPVIPSIAESGAINIAPITDDYDANIRQGNIGYVGTGIAPDIGADEFATVLPACGAVSGGTISPVNVSKCVGQTQGFTTAGYTTGSGIIYQWQVGTLPGGPYVNVVGGIGANTPSYLTPTLTTGTFYYVLLTTCTVSGLNATSNEATVVVNPVPSLTLTPLSSNICLPGSPSVTLTGAGATDYTWTPITGLNTNTGSVVNSTVTSTTIYTVTGMNGFSCTSTATTLVNVSDMPTLSITATPSLLCPGANSSLQAVANSTSYVVSNISYSPVPTPTSGVITLAAGGVQVTPLNSGTLDDGGWTNLSIPFNFVFFGSTYTNFAVSTNGFIALGGGMPNTFTGYGSAYPNAAKARPSIGACYSDLNLSNTGTVTVYTVGVTPNRKVVINWTSAQYYVSSGTITTQAIIHETSNDIEVHTTQATGNNTSVEGIQNAAGTGAFWVNGRNNTNFTVVSPDAYRFSPASYSYSWTPSTFLTGTNIPNPSANTVTTSITYSLNVLASNGCSNSGTVDLAVGVGPTISISGGTAVACGGSSVNLTASGADTYSWSTGSSSPSITVNPTITTAFTVVGTSTAFACPTSVVKTVTVNPVPQLTLNANPTVCMGNSLVLTVSGAQTYSWNTGSTLAVIAVTPTNTTLYSVVGTSSAGCSSSAAQTVTVYALPQLSVSAAPGNTICEQQSATLIGSGISVDSYSWNTGATSPIISVSPSVTTSYTLTGSNNTTGCNNKKVINIVVVPCTGLEEINSELVGLNVYPNPSNGSFFIQLSNGKDKVIEIMDVTGRILITDKTDRDVLKVNMNEFANGVYYAKIVSNNSTEVIKLIKQ